MRAERAGRASYKSLIALILGAWILTVALLWPVHGLLLSFDEIDYFNAARLGLWANVVEQGSLSPMEFYRFANAKRLKQEPELPASYDESRDPLLLRHYHPPFIVYLLSAVTVSDTTNERLIRSVQLLGCLALICAMLFSYRSLSGSPRLPGMLVVSVLGVGLSCLAFYLLSYHGWLAVWTTTTCALLSRWLESGKTRDGVLLCASLALTLITLETGLIIWLGAVICIFIWKPRPVSQQRGASKWRFAIVGTLLTALFIFLFWPGALLKISPVKNALSILYRSALGAEFQRSSRFFLVLLPLLIIVALACFWLFYSQRKTSRRWGPFFVIGLTYFLIIILITPFGLIPEYFVPALAPLACLVGLAVDTMMPLWRIRFITPAVLTLVIASMAITIWSSEIFTLDDGGRREDLVWLKQVLRDQQTLADSAHIYQHHLGPDYKISPISLSQTQDQMFVREKGKYREVTPEEVSGKMVIIPAYRTRLIENESDKIRALLGRCQRLDRTTLRVYDCSKVTTDKTSAPPPQPL